MALYQHLNLWSARILKPHSIKDKENVSGELLVDKLRESWAENGPYFLGHRTAKPKITFQKGKRHIRFESYIFQFPYKNNEYKVECKVRVNPCFVWDCAADEDRKMPRHTKEWVIFDFKTPGSFSAQDIKRIQVLLNQFVQDVYQYIEIAITKVMDNVEQKVAYEVDFITTSLHPDSVSSSIAPLFTARTGQDVENAARDSSDVRGILQDEEVFGIPIDEDVQVAVKNIDSRKCYMRQSIQSGIERTTITWISCFKADIEASKTGVVAETDDDLLRLELLYREPLMKALDFSSYF